MKSDTNNNLIVVQQNDLLFRLTIDDEFAFQARDVYLLLVRSFFDENGLGRGSRLAECCNGFADLFSVSLPQL